METKDEPRAEAGESTDAVEAKGELHQGKLVDVIHSEVLGNRDLMSDAVDGENREHDMGTWEALKNYPWASFWAFIMCFTIVSLAYHSANLGN